jgi:hypothetical protein
MESYRLKRERKSRTYISLILRISNNLVWSYLVGVIVFWCPIAPNKTASAFMHISCVSSDKELQQRQWRKHQLELSPNDFVIEFFLQ